MLYLGESDLSQPDPGSPPFHASPRLLQRSNNLTANPWFMHHNSPSARATSHEPRHAEDTDSLQVGVCIRVSEKRKDFLLYGERKLRSHDYSCIRPEKKFWPFSDYQLFGFWKYLTNGNDYFDDSKSGLAGEHFLTNIPGKQGRWKIIHRFSRLRLCRTAQNRNDLPFFNFPDTLYCNDTFTVKWLQPVSRVPGFTRNHRWFQKCPHSLLSI